MVGKTLAHYRIDYEIGRGGMGVVFKAEDTKLHRTVAIKVLPSAMLASQDDRARFYREARAAAALTHAHIATVYAIDEAVPEGSGDDDVRPFIAMEFIDGPSLAKHIEEGPLPLPEVITIGTQLASALQTAHEHNIVHRDIKSANVMLTKKGEAKVLDFGLAKTVQSTKLTQMGATLGTVAYMSPEQARGEEVDTRTDLWSLGVVLYEMISGRLPYPGDYEQAVIFEILNQDPKPLTAIRTGVPMELEMLVAKLLAKDRELRYQGAADVIADLKRVDLTGGREEGMSQSGMSQSGISRSGTTQSDIARSRVAVSSSGRIVEKGSSMSFRPIHAAAVVLALLIGVAATWLTIGESSASQSTGDPIYLDLNLPDSVVFDDPHWSKDGTRILFSARDGDRVGFIVEYDLSTGTLTELTDADRNIYPKYSPDGKAIYFTRGRNLYRQSNGSRQASLVTKVRGLDELGWISDDEMIFGRDGQVLTRNERTGQEDTLFPGLAASWFNHPFFSHDTRILMYGTLGQMIAVDIETGERIPELELAGLPLGTVMNGYFLFRGLPNQREVWARKIDFGSRKYTSTGRALFESGSTAFSENGHVIYKPLSNPDEPLRNEPIFEYRLGEAGAFVAHAGDYTDLNHGDFQISPDGRFLAVSTTEGIKQFERSSRTSVALVGSSFSAYPTEWSRDGAWLYYHETTNGSTNVYRIRSSGNGEPEPIVVEQTDDRNGSISTDGRILVFERSSAGTGHDIWGKNLISESEFPIVTVAGDQGRPRISPDSRLIAFQSGDADRQSILISNLDGSHTVTVAEGVSNPRWSRDGKYLYYESRTLGAVYRVQILRDPLDESARSPAFGEPRLMFSEPRADHTHWAVTPDNDTILLSWPRQEEKGGSRWKVVLNWAGTLE